MAYSLLQGTFGSASAAAPPTSGYHPVGERVYNSSPANGQPVGWVCISAGSPGTWLPFGTVGTGSSYAGLYRVVVAALGESGMAGAVPYDYTTAPSGWPCVDGSVSVYSATRVRTLPSESVSDQGTSPVDSVFPLAGETWADRFCQLLQQRLGANFEVMLVLCAKSGTTSTDWAVGGSLYNAAVARINAALTLPGATLGCFLLDQGLNDSVPNNWDANWTTIETSLRADIGNTQVPLFFRHQQTSDASITTLRTAQARWVKTTTPQRLMFESPSTGFHDNLHLDTAALMTQAASAAALEAAYPIVPAVPSVALLAPTRAEVMALSSVIELWDMSNAVDGSSWAGLKNGYALTQGTSGKRPTYTADAGNGRPAFRFNAANSQCLVLPSQILTAYAAGTDFGIFIALRMLSVTGALSSLVVLASLATANGNDNVLAALPVVSGTRFGQMQLNRNSNVGPVFQTAATGDRIINIGTPSVYGLTWAGASSAKFYAQSGMVVKKTGDNAAATVASPTGGRLGCWLNGASEVGGYVDGYVSGLAFVQGSASAANAELIGRYFYPLRP